MNQNRLPLIDVFEEVLHEAPLSDRSNELPDIVRPGLGYGLPFILSIGQEDPGNETMTRPQDGRLGLFYAK